MLIDWFTVGAQFINFLVLLWLLKRFLYKPILAAIDARERRIAGELAGAAMENADAIRIRQDLATKTGVFDAERASLLAAAVAGAGVERDRLLAASSTTAAALLLTERAQWQAERVAMNDRLTRWVTTEVFAIARRALGDLAGVGLESRMVDALVRRLRDMEPAARSVWSAALDGDSTGAVVRSRFVLEAPERAGIQAAVSDASTVARPVRFETATEDVCGIEVIAGGQRIAWTVSDYLGSLQAGIAAPGSG